MATKDASQKKFIEKIAPYVLLHAKDYERTCHSVIIAQACLESGYGEGKSILGICKADYHNYFGLKYRKDGRVTNYIGTFKDGSKEQNPDGSYREILDDWYAFSDMEQGVIGYLQFTNTSRYENLKYVTNPVTYLENLRKDGYFTSLSYVNNVLAIINKWGLTKYDTTTDTNLGVEYKMKINVHAGHNPDGKAACGAVGIIKESTEARKVKDSVIKYLQQEGHKVYDCTVNDGASHGVTTAQSDVLQKIVSKCNAHEVDLDVSIHFNSGAKDLLGNNKTTGTEVLVYNNSTSSIATKIANSISSLGFTNRGVKIRTDLYFLKKTKAPAVLVECCFVDDADDCRLYNADAMAKAIVEGILGTSVKKIVTTDKLDAVGTNSECPFIIQCLDNLNIRKTPGGAIEYVDGCKKGTKYTIVKVSGNWGYLKSGRGWVTILNKYVSRS